MRLVDLDARLLRLGPPLTDYGRRPTRFHVDTVFMAQGVTFLCPLCFAEKGEVGCHRVVVWFADRRVPDNEQPASRWTATGTDLRDLSLVPSIHLRGSCGWHGFVTNGEAA